MAMILGFGTLCLPDDARRIKGHASGRGNPPKSRIGHGTAAPILVIVLASSRKDAMRLGVPHYESSGWIAGSIYVRNLGAALQRLPAAERPELVFLAGPRRTRETP